MNKKYLLYFCHGVESVFDSQVLELINFLRELNIFKKVYLFLGIRNENEDANFQKKKINKEIEVIKYKIYPNYCFFNPLLKREIKKVLKTEEEILGQSIFHVREEVVAWQLYNSLGIKYRNKILPDVRGATLEEVYENNRINFLQKFFKIMNNKKALENLNNFKMITAVSPALKDYLVRKFNINEDKIKITPDLAGKNFNYCPSKRKEIRYRLSVDDNDILCLFSSGHTLEWQNWQNSGTVKSIADSGIKILNLSINKIEYKNVINGFADYHSMPDYLNASDVALIWSDKRIVAEVRSPVKFSEYICCGLPIIANDSVKMVSDYIKNTGYGLLIKNEEELNPENIKNLLSLDRNKISIFGKQWVGVEKITRKYCEIYSSLN